MFLNVPFQRSEQLFACFGRQNIMLVQSGGPTRFKQTEPGFLR